MYYFCENLHKQKYKTFLENTNIMDFIQTYNKMREIRSKALEIIANNDGCKYNEVRISLDESNEGVSAYFFLHKDKYTSDILKGGGVNFDELQLESYAETLYAKLMRNDKADRIAELKAELAKLEAE